MGDLEDGKARPGRSCKIRLVLGDDRTNFGLLQAGLVFAIVVVVPGALEVKVSLEELYRCASEELDHGTRDVLRSSIFPDWQRETVGRQEVWELLYFIIFTNRFTSWWRGYVVTGIPPHSSPSQPAHDIGYVVSRWYDMLQYRRTTVQYGSDCMTIGPRLMTGPGG